MRTIGAAQFKAQCLAILDSIDAGGIIITKRGKPVARLVALEPGMAALKGKYRGQIAVLGDILSSERAWRAEP